MWFSWSSNTMSSFLLLYSQLSCFYLKCETANVIEKTLKVSDGNKIAEKSFVFPLIMNAFGISFHLKIIFSQCLFEERTSLLLNQVRGQMSQSLLEDSGWGERTQLASPQNSKADTQRDTERVYLFMQDVRERSVEREKGKENLLAGIWPDCYLSYSRLCLPTRDQNVSRGHKTESAQTVLHPLTSQR